jgi:hypothetical protein
VKDRIQRWASIVLGAAVVVLVAWLTMEQMGHARPRAESGDAGANANANANANASDAGGGSGTGTATGTATAGSGNATGALDTTGDGGFSLSGLSGLLDAGAMPSGAPRSVRLGVVLVQFAGAEGASSSARAKPDALKHALELADQAKTDWKGAVKAGDVGSSDDIGRIPRGVLDHNTELVVFSLEKDGISEPLETPKGYWIVRRVE